MITNQLNYQRVARAHLPTSLALLNSFLKAKRDNISKYLSKLLHNTPKHGNMDRHNQNPNFSVVNTDLPHYLLIGRSL
jgi:hypothetical protein